MIDLNGFEDVKIGEEVVLFGRQGDEYISADEVGERYHTIGYEVVCAVNRRVPRFFIRQGRVVNKRNYPVSYTHLDVYKRQGYTSAVAWEEASDTYTVTLTHTPETTSHDVTKIWDFGQAAFTTGTATIQLLGNGQPAVNADGVTTDEITFVPNGTEDLTWTNLPKYEGGKLITYHAVETQVLDDQGKDVSHHFRCV